MRSPEGRARKGRARVCNGSVADCGDDFSSGVCRPKEKTKCIEQPLPGQWGEAVPHGSCSGLALRRVGLRCSGKGYGYAPKTLVCDGLCCEATRGQDIDAPNGFIGRVEAVLLQYGAVVNRARCYTTLRGVSAEMPANITFAGDGLYYVELVRGGGGHALGFQRDGSAYRSFDGNFGHFISRVSNGSRRS